MQRRILPLLVSVCLTSALGGLRVNAERLPVRLYTSADGLGSGFVDFLMSDSRGFMWFCTRDGLSRFDGSRFITYRVGDKNSPPGIERITETSGGVYWITTTGGLYRFKADGLSRPHQSAGDRPFLSAEFIHSSRGTVFQDRAGNLWYTEGDLYRLRDQEGKVEFEKASLGLPLSPNTPLGIFQMLEGPDGSFWISTNRGIARRLPDGRVMLYQHETDLRISGMSLAMDGKGRVWVVWGDDFFIIKPVPLNSLSDFPSLWVQPLSPNLFASTEPDRDFRLPEKPGDILRLKQTSKGSRTTQMNSLFRSSNDHIWFASGDELREFDGNVFHAYGAAHGLPTGMGDMAEDSAGNLWIASQAGLLRLDRRGLTTYTEADGLNSARLFAINEAADGSLYFANGDFHLSRFDGKGFQNSRPQIASDARITWTSRYAFLSRANEWWILTTDRLYRFASGNLQTPRAIYDSSHGLMADEAFQMFEDSRGDIWLSQKPPKAENNALYRLKRGEEKFYKFSDAESFPSGKAASCFAEDKNGNLWFGFTEGDLVRFANNRFQHFTKDHGVPAGAILDLHVDRSGRLWLASALHGVRRVDDPGAEKPSFFSLTTTDGLSSNNIRTITEDKAGNVYAGTARGVDRISVDTGRIKHYSVRDGLAGDFVVDSHCDRQGVLWFATTNGLSRLLPTVDVKQAAPPVLLGALRIAGEEQAVSELGDAQILTDDLNATRNNLQIEFFGLDFQAGETLRYQFMLEGADSSWSKPTEQRTVTYANLKPGSYRFLVRAVSADSLVSERPASVTFRILPPIWLRWWFLVSVPLLILALLYLFYRYRLARLREVNAALAEAKRAEEDLGRAREERLSELARVRTRIATDLHDDIGASLTQIAILSEVARQQSKQGNGAPTIEPLSSIVNVSNELVETMSDIVWAINPEKDHLQDLIQRMRRFASDLLIPKGISLAFNVPSYEPELPLGANARREVFLIFKESLTNIIKHSKATEVTIQFDFSQNHLTLKVKDNGRGFAVEDLSNSLLSSSKGGHGILSIKKRAAEMNGRVDIISRHGAGTTITFQLPLDPATRHAQETAIQMGGDRRSRGGLN
jgi:signal transduction histidine kinase/ligand-binding sensor domain-containing protein